MQKLFQFLYRYRTFILFIFLQIVSIGFIVQSNSYQGAVYFNSANRFSGNVLSYINNVYGYFRLQQINEQLAEENAQLRKSLTIQKNLLNSQIASKADSLRDHAFQFRSARVINNSTTRFNNYITLNKGYADSIKPGMGVISPLGVVGKINACSNHFSTAISLLHGKWSVSGQIVKGKIDGTVKWDGKNPRYAEMLYVGLHHKVQVNDSIVTTGYNSVYPSGIPIGKVFKVEQDKGRPFFKIKVLLATDFSKLSYVYIIENSLAFEKDSLEQDTLQTMNINKKSSNK
ncbi:MAG: rod shape-determining protein MreC [Cytophagales bacterium]|nr:MAG: rod shape-determining protein MreC [Cytophagales bacterium]